MPRSVRDRIGVASAAVLLVGVGGGCADIVGVPSWQLEGGGGTANAASATSSGSTAAATGSGGGGRRRGVPRAAR